MNNRKQAVISEECVACGCCEQVCSFNAIIIDRGIQAQVNSEKCVGCGKCKKICTASVITIVSKEAVA